MDIMLVVIVLLGMAMVGIVSHNLLKDVNTEIQADPDLNTNVKTQTQTLQTNFPTFMDNAFLLATILLWIFVLVSSVLIDSHPMFMVISVILIIFALGVVMLLSNTFQEYVEEPEYANLDQQFPVTYFIMNNLLTIIIVMAGSVVIALYGKNKFLGT